MALSRYSQSPLLPKKPDCLPSSSEEEFSSEDAPLFSMFFMPKDQIYYAIQYDKADLGGSKCVFVIMSFYLSFKIKQRNECCWEFYIYFAILAVSITNKILKIMTPNMPLKKNVKNLKIYCSHCYLSVFEI